MDVEIISSQERRSRDGGLEIMAVSGAMGAGPQANKSKSVETYGGLIGGGQGNTRYSVLNHNS
jgi:hypothetical protein